MRRILRMMAGALLMASSSGAEGGGQWKAKKGEIKEKAGVVKVFDGAALTLAVAGRKMTDEMSFTVDYLTQFKGDKKELSGGRPVLVAYTVTGGRNVARVISLRPVGKGEKRGDPAP